jgi:hypothetical protein
MFDFTIFYLISGICLGIGVLAVIFRKPISEVMEIVEEHSNGRVEHH